MGTKVKAMINSPKMLGFRTSTAACSTVVELLPMVGVRCEVALDVLDLDDRGVDDHSDRDRQAAQRHQVRVQAGVPHRDERQQRRQRQREDDDQRAANAPQEHGQDDEHQDRALGQGLEHRGGALLDDLRPLVERHDSHPVGQDVVRVDLA